MIHNNHLKKSIEILHTFLLCVIVTYMVEVLQYHSLPAFIILFPVKIYLYSGLYGILIEMIANQEKIFHLRSFHRNVKEYWQVYLLLSNIPFLIHFLIFSIFPPLKISIYYFYAYLNLFVLYLLANWIIKTKYLHPLKITVRGIQVRIKDAGILTAFFVIPVFLCYWAEMSKAGWLDLKNLALFISQYIQFLSFLYLGSLILDQYKEVKSQFEPAKELILVYPLGPAVLEAIGSLFMRFNPPIFVVLKALTPKHYKITEYNRVFFRKRYYDHNKLVAITCFTSNCPEAYKIAKEFRKRGCRVIMGGPHVTYLPDEALEFCDSVVVGDAEGVWKQIIKDYEENDLKKKYYGAAVEADHTQVHQELLNSPPGVIKDYLETSHGCKFQCHFCTIPGLSEGKVRNKPIEEIVSLIEKIKHRYRHVSFIDNNIYNDPAYARELFKALKPLKVKWATQCTIDIAKNDETLKLAKESGCSGFLFGYEIFGSSQEKAQGGKFAMAQKYRQFTQKVKELGIQIKAHFIFGYDSDNIKSLFELWRFCLSLKPYFTIISLLTPLPGSRLYFEMLKENRITNLNWRNYACHSIVFKHKHLNQVVFSNLYFLIHVFFLVTTSFGGMVMFLCLSLVLVIAQIWNV